MKHLKLILGIGISVGLLVWAFSQVDLDSLGQALIKTDYLYVALAIPFLWLLYGVRAWRWKYLLSPLGEVSFAARLASTVIGFTANMILPARLGEVIRAIDLSRREKLPIPSVLATLLLERILDGVVIVGMLIWAAAVLGVFGQEGDMARRVVQAIYLFIVVFTGAIIFITGLVLAPDKVQQVIRVLLTPVPDKFSEKIVDLAGSLVDGLMILRKPKLLLYALGYTLILWVVNMAPMYLLAIGAGHPVPLAAAFFVQGLVCLAVALPSAPGFVGVIHAAMVFGFSDLLGMPSETAMAIAIIYHGSSFIFTVLYGLTYLLRGQVSLFDLGRMAEKQEETDQA